MRALIRRVRAVMGCRILVNFRVRPEVLGRWVPRPFRVQMVDGWGMAGICLIRLEGMRPTWVPGFLGLASENAAHRIAVEWEDAGERRTGVYILRRDTDSWVNRWAGGRLFPGVHGSAAFRTSTVDGRIRCAMRSEDGVAEVRVDVEPTAQWPENSVWGSLAEASEFFRGGCRGWSTARDGRTLEGTELEPEGWEMTPLRVHEAFSSFFGNVHEFPRDAVELDSALLMRGIAHAWTNLGTMGGGTAPRVAGRRRDHGTHGPSALFRLP